MGIAYNSKSIIPAPAVNISKEFQKTEDGTSVGSVFVITLKGKLTADRGSPTAEGTFYTGGGMTDTSQIGLETGINSSNRLTNILRKQEMLRVLFSTEGQVLEIDPIYPDSSSPVQCNPRIKNIVFQEGPWVTECDYTITLEADVIRGAGFTVGSVNGLGGGEDLFQQIISKAQEDWSLEPADEIGRTYRLTHTLSATGKRSYAEDGSLFLGSGAWQYAQLWVQTRMGLDPARVNPGLVVAPSGTSPGSIVNSSGPSAYNFLRAEHVNKMAGTYNINETWLVFDSTGLAAPAIEEYTVNVRTDETGRTSASIDGNIKGLEVRDNSSHALLSTRFSNGLAYWNNIAPGIFSRVQSYAPDVLNPKVLHTSLGQNPITGIITYNQEYNDRPSSNIPGSITEHISVAYDNPSDVVAQVTVLGRQLGPVIQQIGTVTVAHKTLTIEAQMPAATMSNPNPTAPNTSAFVASFAPTGSIVFWLEKDMPNYDYTTGRYTRTTTWAFEGNG